MPGERSVASSRSEKIATLERTFPRHGVATSPRPRYSPVGVFAAENSRSSYVTRSRGRRRHGEEATVLEERYPPSIRRHDRYLCMRSSRLERTAACHAIQHPVPRCCSVPMQRVTAGTLLFYGVVQEGWSKFQEYQERPPLELQPRECTCS